jgi:sulfate adenylyltransferase subunit 1 (EFTu-like GTPase family)
MRIALGAEADVVSGDELGDAKKSILDKIDGSKPSEKRFIARKLSGSGVSTGTAGFVVELYPVGPAAGRAWNLTQIVVVGPDDHTAQSGVSVSWYLGDSSNIGLGQCIRPAMAAPSNYEFSKDVIWMDTNEQLFAVIYGATAGTQFTLMALARDFRQCDVYEQRI